MSYELIIEGDILLKVNGHLPKNKHLILPENVVEIGDLGNNYGVEYGMFFEAHGENLKKITLPSGLKKIGRYAFSYCKSINNIDLPIGLEFIGERAFLFCESLETIRIPKAINFININTFAWCTNLTSVEFLGEDVEIADMAFAWCRNLESIIIPRNCIINKNSFVGCTKLEFNNLIKEL